MTMLKKTEILKQLVPDGEPQTLQLGSSAECSTFNATVWRYNAINGRKEDKYIHMCTDYETFVVTLVCTTYKEYEHEKNHLLPHKWWKSRLSKKKSI